MTSLAEPTGLTLRPAATRAPLLRVLRAELRWVLLRRRTIFAFVGLALIPIAIGIGLSIAAGTGAGPPIAGGLGSFLNGNGMVLPLLDLVFMINMMLPLVSSMFSADAVAGEMAHGTLRGLLVSPVSRLRLVGMKSFGVAAATLLSVLITAVFALVTGLILFGGSGMLTLTGDNIGFVDTLGRLGIAVGWTTLQMWAVAAVALAISTFTDHPLVVMASTLAGIILFTVLDAIPQLSAIHPLLITDGWGGTGLTDLAGDPLDLSTLGSSALVALCYLVIGMSVATIRLINPR